MKTETDSISRNEKSLKYFLIASPFFVLIFTKILLNLFIHFFDREISWIPSFIAYYLSISIVIFIAVYHYKVKFDNIFNLSFKPFPKVSLFIFGIIFPALLPLGVILNKAQYVPEQFFLYILIFSLINPLFEESLWRGLLSNIPMSNWFKILYSSVLFAFSHYFFWDYWYRDSFVTLTTVISTFIMGVCWMWFYLKRKNLIYPIISHFFVDVSNLSVAIYVGVIPLHFF